MAVIDNYNQPTNRYCSTCEFVLYYLSIPSFSYMGPSPQSNVPSAQLFKRDIWLDMNIELNLIVNLIIIGRENDMRTFWENKNDSRPYILLSQLAHCTNAFWFSTQDKGDPHHYSEYDYVMKRSIRTCLFNTILALFKIFCCTKFELRVR